MIRTAALIFLGEVRMVPIRNARLFTTHVATMHSRTESAAPFCVLLRQRARQG